MNIFLANQWFLELKAKSFLRLFLAIIMQDVIVLDIFSGLCLIDEF